MSRFDFITDEGLRSSLESDHQEVQHCIEHGAFKAVHVLAGSVIEAVLMDYLAGLPDHPPNLLRLDLSELVRICRERKIISEKAADLSSVVRMYRNLIHPGRMERLGERVTKTSAAVAVNVVEMIVDEVCERKRSTYGFTAEQLISKVIRDPGSKSILKHLLDGINPKEVERLLRQLPQVYLQLRTDNEFDAFSGRLVTPYRSAFDVADEPLKRRVVADFTRILKNDDADTVGVYETVFFKGSDLAYASKGAVPMISKHVIQSVEQERKNYSYLQGIGSYLDSVETVRMFVAFVCVRMIRDAADEGRRKYFTDLILDEYRRVPPGPLRDAFRNGLAKLQEHYPTQFTVLSILATALDTQETAKQLAG